MARYYEQNPPADPSVFGGRFDSREIRAAPHAMAAPPREWYKCAAMSSTSHVNLHQVSRAGYWDTTSGRRSSLWDNWPSSLSQPVWVHVAVTRAQRGWWRRQLAFYNNSFKLEDPVHCAGWPFKIGVVGAATCSEVVFLSVLHWAGNLVLPELCLAPSLSTISTACAAATGSTGLLYPLVVPRRPPRFVIEMRYCEARCPLPTRCVSPLTKLFDH